MTAHFTDFSVSRSQQVRIVDPETGEMPDPRCIEMAEAMREGATEPKLLFGAGFTAAEIVEYGEMARRIATERSVYRLRPAPDTLEEVIIKAREAVPNRPPLPRGIDETQGALVAWAQYCQARNALMLYPWPPLREHCLKLLADYLARSEMFMPSRRTVVEAVAKELTKVAQ